MKSVKRGKDDGLLPLAAATHAFEAGHIRRALEIHGGRISHAAQALGMARTNLYRKMRQRGVSIPRKATR